MKKPFLRPAYNYKYTDTNKRTDYNCNLTIIAIIVDSLTIVNRYLYEMLTDRIFELWGE